MSLVFTPSSFLPSFHRRRSSSVGWQARCLGRRNQKMLSQGMWMQKIKGGRDSRPQVKEEDKTTVLIQHPGSNYKSKTILINESGLYSLILSSKLPQTREFKRRVTSEVLGQIRKMGGYILINGCDLVLWFYSSIIFRDTHTI